MQIKLDCALQLPVLTEMEWRNFSTSISINSFCRFLKLLCSSPQQHLTMSSGFLAQLVPAGTKSKGASTSMMRLPTRHSTRSCRSALGINAFGTLAPTPPRRNSGQAKSNRNGDRIDEVEHIPTSFLGRALLTTGSAMGLLNNPSRGGKGTMPRLTSSRYTWQ